MGKVLFWLNLQILVKKNKMKILITGKTGYLSKALVKEFSKKYEITCIGREDLQLTDRDAVNNWFKNKYFDVVLHTAITGGNRLIPEVDSILLDNLKIFFNLLNQKDKYKKFINFGSIAECNLYESLYGLSKNIIAKYIKDEDQFYNLRICGLFDQNDLNTRFIKNNIKNYIQKKDIIIHNNKYMDFIYMKDLINIINHYINNEDLPKTIDCVYSNKYSLVDIANLINNLNSYKCKIKLENLDKIADYIGNGDSLKKLNLNLIGLQESIKITYNLLLDEYS
jgi:nucleoside-diphosphate-sugar epimerase